VRGLPASSSQGTLAHSLSDIAPLNVTPPARVLRLFGVDKIKERLDDKVVERSYRIRLLGIKANAWSARMREHVGYTRAEEAKLLRVDGSLWKQILAAVDHPEQLGGRGGNQGLWELAEKLGMSKEELDRYSERQLIAPVVRQLRRLRHDSFDERMQDGELS